jgi:hypothetical protein
MCSQYWNLTAEVTCPHCGNVHEDTLQTHWMGEIGSCLNFYVLGERIPELHGIQAAVLDGVVDDFISDCRACGNWSIFGARIVDEAVVEVFPLAAVAISSEPPGGRP